MIKLLIAHNEYQQSGGEDTLVRNEIELLKKNGHDVSTTLVSNESIKTLSRKMSVAWNATYSESAKQAFLDSLNKIKPDLVHVHNFFPLFTPSIYDACKASGIPVVQSLHNFRIACANGLLLRDGKVCEDCLGKSAWPAVVYGCYRDSRLASIPVARMIDHHRKKHTWAKKVDRFIVSSEFTKFKLVHAGVPSEKFAIKPNFIFGPDPDHFKPVRPHHRPTALYVGRLSKEKGIRTMLRAWRDLAIPLRVVGDGPLMDEVRNEKNPSIKILGKLPAKEDVWNEMLSCDFLVIPSECYENFPLTLAEGFANGIPVIGSKQGSLGSLIKDGETGLLFANGDWAELRKKVEFLAASRELAFQMGQNARKTYEQSYTPEQNYRELIKIYESVLP